MCFGLFGFFCLVFFLSEITKLRLQSAQDAARQVEMEVAERVSVLEEEHKAKLSLLHSEKQHIAELSEEIKHLKEEITRQKDFFCAEWKAPERGNGRGNLYYSTV